jgi:hypothetical protein
MTCVYFEETREKNMFPSSSSFSLRHGRSVTSKHIIPTVYIVLECKDRTKKIVSVRKGYRTQHHNSIDFANDQLANVKTKIQSIFHISFLSLQIGIVH